MRLGRTSFSMRNRQCWEVCNIWWTIFFLLFPFPPRLQRKMMKFGWTKRLHQVVCSKAGRVLIPLMFIITCIFLYFYSPIMVYILDRLNLRVLFLPNLHCDHCNNFTVRYVIEDKDYCSGSEVFLVILVITFHTHIDARNAIRKTWGGVDEYRGLNTRLLFALGVHEDKNFNMGLLEEQKKYGDILQGDFTEDYRTLTNKTMMSLDWITRHCGHAKYILKTDDDSFNIPQHFMDALVSVRTDKYVGGYCLTIPPDRRTWSKYYVDKSVYPDTYYPTYCAGPGYILSLGAARDIVRVAPHVIYIPMEDVYVAGLCRHAAGIKYTQMEGMIVGRDQMDKCALSTWVKNGHNIVPEHSLALWKSLQEANPETDCFGRNTGMLILVLFLVFIWIRIIIGIFSSR